MKAKTWALKTIKGKGKILRSSKNSPAPHFLCSSPPANNIISKNFNGKTRAISKDLLGFQTAKIKLRWNIKHRIDHNLPAHLNILYPHCYKYW